MAKPKKGSEREIFGSIRKPTAPPAKKMGSDIPEEKLRPSLRKAKHKKKASPETE